MPHPQPGVLDIQGVQSEGQVGVVVEELVEAIMLGAAEFQGPNLLRTHLGTNGIWRCMFRAWMRRHTNGLL